MEFNLVDEKWIPCLMLKENRAEELSLRETLTNAHRICEIFDNSPLVTISLHRLLLAILHRNFGPASFGKWQELWKQKQWNTEKLNQYFDEWKHRFDLFDEERPFYQTTIIKSGKGEEVKNKPVSALAQEMAGGNNATLFDHNSESSGKSFSPAETVRYLIATQAYSLGGGNSYPFNFSQANLSKGITFLAIGENLFETLALNLVPYNQERPFPHSDKTDDLPIWEQDELEEPNAKGTDTKGYLDYLTWQSRKIKLEDFDGEKISSCRIQQNLVLSSNYSTLDPLKCFVVDKTEGITPLKFNFEKSLWRDSHSLFQNLQVESKEKRSLALTSFLGRIEKARTLGEIEAKTQYTLMALGLVTKDKAANVVSWSNERLPLPMIYSTDEGKDLVNQLKDALKLADDFANKVLFASVRLLAKFLLAPDPKSRQPDGEDVGRLMKTFGVDGIYWARLNQPFNKLLVDLPKDFAESAIDKDTTQKNKALKTWAETLDKTIRTAFDSAVNSLSNSARELKAVAEAEKNFWKNLRNLKKENPHLFVVKTKNGGEMK